MMVRLVVLELNHASKARQENGQVEDRARICYLQNKGRCVEGAERLLFTEEMKHIKIYCRGCKASYWVERTKEIPVKAIVMACNWCPVCEDMAVDYYKEWYLYEAKSQCPTERHRQLRLKI